MNNKEHTSPISGLPVRQVIITDSDTELDDLYSIDEAAMLDIASGVELIGEEELIVKRI
jgi:hypothetical protein